MLLVPGDDRTDLDIPDLLSERLGIRATQSLPATAAGVESAGNDGFAFGRWNERAFNLIVPALPATLTFRPGLLLGPRFRVRMFGRGRLQSSLPTRQ